MFFFRTSLLFILKLLVFWLIVFESGRLLFSAHNWNVVSTLGFSEWLSVFIYSIRLDLATASLLSIIPSIFLLIYLWKQHRIFKLIGTFFIVLELIAVIGIIAGEINAYPEWNHKLTTRVFMHFLHPDEVVRTADWSMILFFILYSAILAFCALFLFRKWLLPSELSPTNSIKPGFLPLVSSQVFSIVFLFIVGRGGIQQIPINTDAAYFSKEYAANDLSVNPVYFFVKSFILYNRSESGAMFPKVEQPQAKELLRDFYSYPLEHNNFVLNEKRPNVVIILLESWSANAIGCLGAEKSATPKFDQLAKEGILFTNLYATGGTSEIGNASLFSGYPALPEIFITMQPEKHRQLPSLNQELEKWRYSSHYLFSGDLSYGNIGGYLSDHGFDHVLDEQDFPKNLPKGKLNYYDEDLYRFLMKRINSTKGPFIHCAFTGSTHSPYDYPKAGVPDWTGEEKDFMRSLQYADKELFNFLENCKKEPWYDNTIFVLVADHGHAAPGVRNPNLGAYFKIPMLILGKPLKAEWKGKRIEKLGSQADVARTLLYQMGGDYNRFTWSKDLLNPNCPEFALHTINRGFGWVTPKGNFSYNMDAKRFLDNSFASSILKKEERRCHAFMSLLFDEYSAR